MLEFNATVLAQIADFIILLIFLRLVVYKPLTKLLASRSEHIANTIAAAEQERQQAEQLKAGYEAEMRRAREQAQEPLELPPLVVKPLAARSGLLSLVR